MRKIIAYFYFSISLLIDIFIIRKKILIVIDQYGRLGNRLYLFAQLIEYSKRTKREIWMPGFYDYADFFESFKDNRLTKFPIPIKRCKFFLTKEYFSFCQKLPAMINYSRINKWFLFVSFYSDNDGNPFEKLMKCSKPCILFSGFIFNNFSLSTKKSKKEIDEIFIPNNKFFHDIKEPIQKLLKNSNIIVGVLIRQTDYREWNQGRHFYSSKQYAKILLKFNKKYPQKNISYFIASDESQDEILFKDLNCIIRVGYPLENMYTLSKCDYLIGPPSSYIGWSSFYGNIPLFSITSENDLPCFDEI